MRSYTLSAVVLGATLFLGACSDDDSTTGPSAGTAAVRVAHLSPDAPPVDVRVNGNPFLLGVPFTAVSDYAVLPAGTATRITVTPAGATSPVVIDATLTLGEGRSYTVAATGLLGANDLRPLVLEDDRGTSGGQAKVRFVHASPDAPAVDVATVGGAPVFPNVPFRGATSYGTLPPGSYNLEVRAAGTSVVALTVPGVSLNGSTNYTIFAIGRLGNQSLAALPAVDAP